MSLSPLKFWRKRSKSVFAAEKKTWPVYEVHSRLVVPDTVTEIAIDVVCEHCHETFLIFKTKADFLKFLHWCGENPLHPKESVKEVQA